MGSSLQHNLSLSSDIGGFSFVRLTFYLEIIVDPEEIVKKKKKKNYGGSVYSPPQMFSMTTSCIMIVIEQRQNQALTFVQSLKLRRLSPASHARICA